MAPGKQNMKATGSSKGQAGIQGLSPEPGKMFHCFSLKIVHFLEREREENGCFFYVISLPCDTFYNYSHVIGNLALPLLNSISL